MWIFSLLQMIAKAFTKIWQSTGKTSYFTVYSDRQSYGFEGSNRRTKFTCSSFRTLSLDDKSNMDFDIEYWNWLLTSGHRFVSKICMILLRFIVDIWKELNATQNFDRQRARPFLIRSCRDIFDYTANLICYRLCTRNHLLLSYYTRRQRSSVFHLPSMNRVVSDASHTIHPYLIFI